MKHKRTAAAALALTLMFSLSACRLAREDGGENKSEDRLIGVFVTPEYLDLFDFEAYMNDNIGSIMDGGEISADGKRYQGRLYATLKPQTLTNLETGETTEMREYVFEDVAGVPYYAATVPATAEEDSYTSSSSDGAVSDGHTGLHYGDDEDKITLEGTIYLLPRQDASYYVNPVYQSADGSVYAVTGSGYMMSGVQSEGSVFTQTIEATTAITENGKSKKQSSSIKVSLAVMFIPEEIVLLQMDDDSAMLAREAYTPGTLPDKLRPEANTAYILVETRKRDSEGKVQVTRTVCDRNDESMESFYARADGVCVKQWTALEWPGA